VPWNEPGRRPRPAGLLAIALLVLILAAGCLGGGVPESSGTSSPTTSAVGDGDDRNRTATAAPDYRTHVLDRYHDRAPVRGGIAAAEDVRTRRYATLATSSADVDRFRFGQLGAETAAFVNRTDFATSYLVVVQTFPASSYPDYRVEDLRRAGGTVRLSINDSSRGATTDITVETLLVRVDRDDRAPPDRAVVTTEEGRRFDSTAGVVTDTPRPTQPPTPAVTLPYASDDPAENVATPLGIRVANGGTRTHGYRVTVAATTDAGERVLLDRRGKLPANRTLSIPGVVARTGTYDVTVTAELPAGDGGRRTVRETTVWRVDAAAGPLAVRVTDDELIVRPTMRNGSTGSTAPAA